MTEYSDHAGKFDPAKVIYAKGRIRYEKLPHPNSNRGHCHSFCKSKLRVLTKPFTPPLLVAQDVRSNERNCGYPTRLSARRYPISEQVYEA